MRDIYEQPRDAVFPRFKVAFIGGGVNSAVGRAHFNAMRMDGLYEVVAGCFSRDPAVNAETGRFYGVDPDCVYHSYTDLIAKERENLDAVVVLTPPALHQAPVVHAMEAGIPVICEKPLATTPQEARAILEAERRNQAFLAVTYNYTGYPALRELRSMIHDGRLGRLLHFSAEMPQESYLRVDGRGDPLKPQEWRLKDGAIPKVYLDLASHLHQISHYLMDVVPTRVVAHHRSYGNFPGIIDYVDAAVDYGDDIHGTYYFGKSMLGYRNGLRIRVFGDRGSADWEQARPEELRMAYSDGRIEVLDRGGLASICNGDRYARFKAGHPAGYIEAFANLYCDIHSALMMFKSNGEWCSEEVFGSGLALEGLLLLAGMAQAARRESAVQLEHEQVATIRTGYVGGGLE